MTESPKDDGVRRSASIELAACTGAGYIAVDASTNVSQSNFGQMTSASCGSAPAADSSAKWICEVCTYQNFPMSKRCTMCRSNKPLLGEDIFRLQDEGATAMPTLPYPEEICRSDGAAAIEERLRPMRISSPPPQSAVLPGASVSKWSCPTCTYENWPKAQRCAMCGHSGSPQHALHAHDDGNNRHRPASRTKIGINDLCNSQNASIHEMDSNNRRTKRLNNSDWVWLQACLGVVEGDASCVEAYLASGGEVARSLTHAEVALLNRASAFDVGHTLVHLAIRFQREDILTTLLSKISGNESGVKRAPSYIAPDLATEIRRHVAASIRYNKKGSFQCRYLQDFATFSLPADIEELPGPVQEQLFSELLDRDAQRTLEAEPGLINWSLELTVRLGSRLYALWNRSAGDCLLDAVMQSAWGVFDRENVLRRALADSLHHATRCFYERWHNWECLQAALLQYTPEDHQLRAEWARLVAAAAIPGTPLLQMHVFALAHVMRRPIIVYGVNVVNSYKGEAIGYARFQGVYLPLLWEPEFCSKSPLCLGYTRGHFSALVSTEPYSQADSAAYICRDENEHSHDITFLPLTDSDGKLLPVHYLTCDEMADEEGVLRRWLSVCVISGGQLVAQQHLHKRPLLVAQLLEEWLNYYRRQSQQSRGPFPPRLHTAGACEYSSDGDTDEE